MSAIPDHDRLARLATLAGGGGASLLACLSTRIESDLQRLCGDMGTARGGGDRRTIDEVAHGLRRGLLAIGAEELAELSREAELFRALGDDAGARRRVHRLARQGRELLVELGAMERAGAPATLGRAEGGAGRTRGPERGR